MSSIQGSILLSSMGFFVLSGGIWIIGACSSNVTFAVFIESPVVESIRDEYPAGDLALFLVVGHRRSLALREPATARRICVGRCECGMLDHLHARMFLLLDVMLVSSMNINERTSSPPLAEFCREDLRQAGQLGEMAVVEAEQDFAPAHRDIG